MRCDRKQPSKFAFDDLSSSLFYLIFQSTQGTKNLKPLLTYEIDVQRISNLQITRNCRVQTFQINTFSLKRHSFFETLKKYVVEIDSTRATKTKDKSSVTK